MEQVTETLTKLKDGVTNLFSGVTMPEVSLPSMESVSSMSCASFSLNLNLFAYLVSLPFSTLQVPPEIQEKVRAKTAPPKEPAEFVKYIATMFVTLGVCLLIAVPIVMLYIGLVIIGVFLEIAVRVEPYLLAKNILKKPLSTVFDEVKVLLFEDEEAVVVESEKKDVETGN